MKALKNLTHLKKNSIGMIITLIVLTTLLSGCSGLKDVSFEDDIYAEPNDLALTDAEDYYAEPDESDYYDPAFSNEKAPSNNGYTYYQPNVGLMNQPYYQPYYGFNYGYGNMSSYNGCYSCYNYCYSCSPSYYGYNPYNNWYGNGWNYGYAFQPNYFGYPHYNYGYNYHPNYIYYNSYGSNLGANSGTNTTSTGDPVVSHTGHHGGSISSNRIATSSNSTSPIAKKEEDKFQTSKNNNEGNNLSNENYQSSLSSLTTRPEVFKSTEKPVKENPPHSTWKPANISNGQYSNKTTTSPAHSEYTYPNQNNTNSQPYERPSSSSARPQESRPQISKPELPTTSPPRPNLPTTGNKPAASKPAAPVSQPRPTKPSGGKSQHNSRGGN